MPPVYKLGDFGLMINYEKDAMSDAQEGDSRFKLLHAKQSNRGYHVEDYGRRRH